MPQCCDACLYSSCRVPTVPQCGRFQVALGWELMVPSGKLMCLSLTASPVGDSSSCCAVHTNRNSVVDPPSSLSEGRIGGGRGREGGRDEETESFWGRCPCYYRVSSIDRSVQNLRDSDLTLLTLGQLLQLLPGAIGHASCCRGTRNPSGTTAAKTRAQRSARCHTAEDPVLMTTGTPWIRTQPTIAASRTTRAPG